MTDELLCFGMAPWSLSGLFLLATVVSALRTLSPLLGPSDKDLLGFDGCTGRAALAGGGVVGLGGSFRFG